MIKVKRIYAKPDKEDGCRILVDRLWPRGLSKKKAKIDLWLKEIAPGEKRFNNAVALKQYIQTKGKGVKGPD